ncbi:immunoglobulin-like domain-containing protein [Listeria rustica]|nr:immunoglobulin-like domain-containing protein [Listeria rustica]
MKIKARTLSKLLKIFLSIGIVLGTLLPNMLPVGAAITENKVSNDIVYQEKDATGLRTFAGSLQLDIKEDKSSAGNDVVVLRDISGSFNSYIASETQILKQLASELNLTSDRMMVVNTNPPSYEFLAVPLTNNLAQINQGLDSLSFGASTQPYDGGFTFAKAEYEKLKGVTTNNTVFIMITDRDSLVGGTGVINAGAQQVKNAGYKVGLIYIDSNPSNIALAKTLPSSPDYFFNDTSMANGVNALREMTQRMYTVQEATFEWTVSDKLDLSNIVAKDDQGKIVPIEITGNTIKLKTPQDGDKTIHIEYSVKEKERLTEELNVGTGTFTASQSEQSVPKVSIQSNNIPVIHASNQTVSAGDPFNPLTSVTADDVEDGDLTASIKVTENTVNVKKEGNYTVKYEVTDKDGNTATKEITVTVVADGPQIAAKNLEAVAGTSAADVSWFTDVTASDKVDGDLSTKVTVDYSQVNFVKEGAYPVIYNIETSNQKTATTTVTMTITADKPVIAAKDLTVIAGQTSSDVAWFTNVTATDKADGDISNQVKVDNSQVNFAKEGTYPVTYSVTNSNHKTATKEITLTVTADKPVVTAKNLAAIAGSKADQVNWFTDVSATDRVDGDISQHTKVDYSAVNFSKEGSYPVIYTVENSNQKTASITVNMLITADKPVLTAKDLTTIAGTSASSLPWFTDVKATDKADGDISQDVKVDYSAANFQKEGTYPVTYTVKNSNNKETTTTVNLTVLADAPSLQAQDMAMIAGDNVAAHSWFTGVTASDKVDGNISKDVTVDYSQVNSKKEGAYPVIYSITNSNGKTTTVTVNLTVSAKLPALTAVDLVAIAGQSADEISWYNNVTASDKVDGDISKQVSVDYNQVNFKKEGSYAVTYRVENSNKKVTTQTVTMTITAQNPVISATNLATIAGDTASDVDWFAGVKAQDKVDGDISKDAKVDYSTVNFNKEGVYPIVYSVKNSNNKESYTTINLQVSAEDPNLSAKDLTFVAGDDLAQVAWFTDTSATDKVDGDISKDVKVDYSKVNGKKEGTYPVVYSITNSNDKTTTMTVAMAITAEAPALETHDLTAIAGDTDKDIAWYEDMHATDKVDADISANIKVDYNAINFAKEGTYPVIYTITNSNDKTTTNTVNMVVTAEAPVIEAEDLNATAGDTESDVAWFDQATATDRVDGDISDALEVDTNAVDFSKEGDYPVAYTITNSNDKTTEKIVRLVVTAENPTITAKDITIKAGTKEDEIEWFTDAKASDRVDGDISEDIEINTDGINTLKEASYPVTYSVTNSNGKTATTTIQLQVTASAPELDAKDLTEKVGVSPTDVDWMKEVTATDDVDADILKHVKVDYSQVDFTKAGDYKVTYSVTNSNNKTASKIVTMTLTAEAPILIPKPAPPVQPVKPVTPLPQTGDHQENGYLFLGGLLISCAYVLYRRKQL